VKVTTYQSYLAAFMDGLRQLRWTEGQRFASMFAGAPGDAALASLNRSRETE